MIIVAISIIRGHIDFKFFLASDAVIKAWVYISRQHASAILDFVNVCFLYSCQVQVRYYSGISALASGAVMSV